MQETIQPKQEYLNKNEFAELIPHLDVKEVLCVEFYVANRWKHLLATKQMNQQNFHCNLCRAFIGSFGNICSHFEGRKHKCLMQKVKYLYHADYTYPKAIKTLRNTSSATGRNVRQKTSRYKWFNPSSVSTVINTKQENVSNSQPNISNNTSDKSDFENVPTLKLETVDEIVESNNNSNNVTISVPIHESNSKESKDINISNELSIPVHNENKSANIKMSDADVGDGNTITAADHSSNESLKTTNSDIAAHSVRLANKRLYSKTVGIRGETVNGKLLRLHENDTSAVNETSTKCHGILGVEYVIKIMKSANDKSPRFECVLCKLVLAGRLMQDHLVCYNHRLNFCEEHFPITMRCYRSYLKSLPDYEIYNVLAPILDKLCKAIEEYHGRSLPVIVLETDYNDNRNQIISNIMAGPHASELCGPMFTQIVSSEEIDELILQRTSTEQQYAERLKYSTANAALSMNLPVKSKSQSSRQEANYSLITKSSSSEQSSSMQHTAWQKYCKIVDKEMNVLDDSYKAYWQQPESHPKYNSEWKAFWKRQKRQVISKGIDYRTYNFQPEWLEFFKNRIKELYYEDANALKYKVLMQLALPKTNEFLSDIKYHVDFDKVTAAVETTLLPKQQQHQQDVRSPQLMGETKDAFNENKSQVVSVLRIMAALEDHLGSLGPKIIHLLSKALQLEKNNPAEVISLLLNEKNCCTIETAKEKFKGAVLAGIFEGSKQRALSKAIASAESLLAYVEQIKKQNAETSAVRGSFVQPINSSMPNADSNPNLMNGLPQSQQSNLPAMLDWFAAQNGNMPMDPAQLQQLTAAYNAYEKNQSDMTNSTDQFSGNFAVFMNMMSSTNSSANNEMNNSSSNINCKQFTMNPFICDSSFMSDNQGYIQSLAAHPGVSYANNFHNNNNNDLNNTYNLTGNTTNISGCNASSNGNYSWNNCNDLNLGLNAFANQMQNANDCYSEEQCNRNSRCGSTSDESDDQSLQPNSPANNDKRLRGSKKVRRFKRRRPMPFRGVLHINVKKLWRHRRKKFRKK